MPPPACEVHQLLEGCFLVTSTLILTAGMVFSSDGFHPGSVGYNLLSAVVAATIVGATAWFVLLLGCEIGRSIVFAAAHALQRRTEEEALEVALRGNRRSLKGPPRDPNRRQARSSTVHAMRLYNSIVPSRRRTVRASGPVSGLPVASQGPLELLVAAHGPTGSGVGIGGGLGLIKCGGHSELLSALTGNVLDADVAWHAGPAMFRTASHGQSGTVSSAANGVDPLERIEGRCSVAFQGANAAPLPRLDPPPDFTGGRRRISRVSQVRRGQARRPVANQDPS
jgi:hypothetical protein